MNFPNAFQKLLVGTDGFPAKSGEPTFNLTAGQIGIINADTNKIEDIDTPGDYADAPLVYLAQGSFRTSDKLGQFHGGYQETVKSKGINPRYVSSFFVTSNAPAQAHKVSIGLDAPGTVAPKKTFHLRVDVKGSSVLRTLNHNAYFAAPAYSGCGADDATPVNSITIYEQWAKAINEYHLINKFITAEIEYYEWDGADTFVASTTKSETFDAKPDAEKYVKLILTGSYVDSKFGDSSFDRFDHVEYEPITIYSSIYDEADDVCDPTVLGSTTDIDEPKQAKGYDGERLIRELILDKSYRQETFHDDNNRLREVVGESSLTDLTRENQYVVYNILHSIPRRSNPTGMLDADQYLIKIVVNVRDAKFEDWLNGYLSSANNPVTLIEV